MTSQEARTLTGGTPLYHKFLGEVEYTMACAAKMMRHTDITSMFVEQDGEMLEVSTALVNPMKVPHHK